MKKIENDQEKLYHYLKNEVCYNTYVLGDLAKYGLSSKEIVFYCQLDDEEKYKVILMKYMDDFVVYSASCDFDEKLVSEQIKLLSETEDFCISGKQEVVKKIVPYFPDKKVRNTYFAQYCKNEIKSNFASVRLKETDSRDLKQFYTEIDEFRKKYEKADSLDVIKNSFNEGRTFAIYKNGKIVCSASSTAESNICAMITNVGTHPNYRGKGYATSVVSDLICCLKEDGVENICLYYDNPTAGRIYKKIGFVDIGIYTVLR